VKRIILAALAFGLVVGLRSPVFAGAAGATTAVACATTSTALLALNDLGTGVARHVVIICNDGPGIGYVAFGTTNAATVTNGIPIEPMSCLPPLNSVVSPNGVVALPSQLDIACISDSAAVANMVALDY